MIKTSVEINLPKFTMETKYNLRNILIEMGMPTPFTPSADFSGMTGIQDLFIDSVIHQGFIEVNEQGTEAAAATAVTMTMSAGPDQSIVFNADHPFLYLIQHKETETILFMGKVVDPLE